MNKIFPLEYRTRREREATEAVLKYGEDAPQLSNKVLRQEAQANSSFAWMTGAMEIS